MIEFRSEPLVRIERGGRLESLHRGVIAAADASGRLLAHLGDPDTPVFIRSGAKPFQLLALVRTGAADHFAFSDADLAVMAASHSGQPAHVERVRAILARAGASESDLLCGAHPPVHGPSAASLRVEGRAPGAVHNNCSGKHAGMLALAAFLGAPFENYIDPDHPVQRRIREAVAEAAGLAPADLIEAVDGCSAPTFGMPLRCAATAFARLAAVPDASPHPASPTVETIVGRTAWTSADALSRIGAAMRAHPFDVAGDGRFDTDLMRAAAGRLVSKSGAEGFYGAGVSEAALRVQGVRVPFGLALKVEDGDLRRVGSAGLLAALEQLGALSAADRLGLGDAAGGPLRNHAGRTVGQVRTDLQLRWDV